MTTPNTTPSEQDLLIELLEEMVRQLIDLRQRLRALEACQTPSDEVFP